MKKYKIVIAVILAFFVPAIIFAGEPKIISVTMNPVNPGYGDLVTIEVTACVDKNFDNFIDLAISNSALRKSVGSAGQVFVVSTAGVNVPMVNPNIAASEVGYLFAASAPAAVNDCTDCSGNINSYTVTRQYVLNMPSSSFYGSCGETGQLYLHAAMKQSNLAKGDWMGITTCSYSQAASWAQPVPVQNFTVAKNVEGTLQTAGDMLLYKVDYTYQNGAGFRIADNIPAGFTLVSYGPTAIPGGSVASGSVMTWNFPSMAGQPGQKSGTVWMLLAWDGIGAGPFTNTAIGSWAGAGAVNTSVTTVVGAAALKITKTQSRDQLQQNETMTYYMSYEISGYSLRSFNAFDDATGVYSGGFAPPGWKSLAESGVHGTWMAEDPCSTGNKYITGSSTQYPGLILDDGNTANASDQFCEGMIVSDFMVGASTTFPGADAQILIRNNGQYGVTGVSYGIVSSIDSAPSPGYFMLMKCAGGCSFPAGGMPSIGAPVAGKWYRVRIAVTNSGGGQIIKARIWARGDPEPGMWDINYTDPTALSDPATDCSGTGTWNDWRPGVNEQSGDYDDVLDSYDNFTTYGPRLFSAAPYVHDDVPAGMVYAGCDGCALSGGSPRWTLPNTSFQSGSFTWWAMASACGTVSNQALINGGSDIYSNWVTADVLCWSPTFTRTITPTFTATPTFTSTPVIDLMKSIDGGVFVGGDTITFTISYANNSASPFANYEILDTLPTYSDFIGSSPLPDSVVPGTGGYSNVTFVTWNIGNLPAGGSGTISCRIKRPINISAGMMRNNCVVDNEGRTSCVSFWAATATGTVTRTPTVTSTRTSTATPSFTVTFSGPTGTAFPSGTATPVFTGTLTPYVLFTPSISATPDFTGTLTPSPSLTATCACAPSFTNTPTLTVTRTVTAATPSQTATATASITPGCAVPAISVKAVYNPGSWDHVLLEISSTAALGGLPSVRVVPHGNNDNKPEYTFTASLVTSGPPEVYNVIYPKTNAWGDIDSIFVSGIDACGNSFTSSGAYTKEVQTTKNWQIFKNIINPEKGERSRLAFKANSGDKVKIKVYTRKGAMVRNLYETTVVSDGQFDVIWDGKNDKAEYVVSGIYMIHIECGNYKAMEKIAVIH